jgi:dolichol-phosphate mannosyltransferase
LIGFPLHASSDYKLLDRKVVEALKTVEERSRLFRGIVPWLGFRRATLPFSVADRISGRSHWSKRKLIRLALNTITSFSFLPLHLVTIIGVFTLCFSLLIGIPTLYLKWVGKAVSGFTTVILLLLFMNGVLMISLGIIGEYMARIYEEVKKRPLYVIEKRLESDHS